MTIECPPERPCSGQGYEADDAWAKLPSGWSFAEVTAVATDSCDRVYVFDRGEHRVMIFEADGTFVDSWGESVFARPHGISLGPDDAVYCTSDVGRFQVGDRVAARAKLPCVACPLCNSERSDLCRKGPVTEFDLPERQRGGGRNRTAGDGRNRGDPRLGEHRPGMFADLPPQRGRRGHHRRRPGRGLQNLPIAGGRPCSERNGMRYRLGGPRPHRGRRRRCGLRVRRGEPQARAGRVADAHAGPRHGALRWQDRGGLLVRYSLQLDVDLFRERSLRYLFPDISNQAPLEHTVWLVATGRVRLRETITHVLQGIASVPKAFEITANNGTYKAINPAQVMIQACNGRTIAASLDCGIDSQPGP